MTGSSDEVTLSPVWAVSLQTDP